MADVIPFDTFCEIIDESIIGRAVVTGLLSLMVFCHHYVRTFTRRTNSQTRRRHMTGEPCHELMMRVYSIGHKRRINGAHLDINSLQTFVSTMSGSPTSS